MIKKIIHQVLFINISIFLINQIKTHIMDMLKSKNKSYFIHTFGFINHFNSKNYFLFFVYLINLTKTDFPGHAENYVCQ